MSAHPTLTVREGLQRAQDREQQFLDPLDHCVYHAATGAAVSVGLTSSPWDQLGQTVGSLKSAWQSGLYGYQRYAAVGTNINPTPSP